MDPKPSSSTSQSKEHEDKIVQFCSITGSGPEVARKLLDACNGQLEMAVNMHLEGVDVNSAASNGDAGRLDGSAGGIATTSKGPADEDNVRAPIPQRREVLVGDGYEGYAIKAENPHKNRIKTVFDGFRNFNSEAENYSSSTESSLPINRGKKRTLEELFKPPLDIMYKGDWQSARDKAETDKKWLLVNIQDAGEFQCQVLNRDVWSSEAVKSIIKEHFLFWQQYKESENAQRYMTFYPVTEWPHVSVLDPRTGEKLVTWTTITDANCFCELVTEFLSQHPSFSETKTLPPASKKSKLSSSILDADEEDQIAAAIQASLADQAPSSSSTAASKEPPTLESDSEPEIEPFSGEESNLSVPTPVKKRSQANSRANSPPKDAQRPKSEINNAKESGRNLPLDGEDVADPDEWKQYVPEENETVEKSKILIRFPDGKRESKNIPSTSQFKAISLYVSSCGFPLKDFEIVTNFPRRILTDLDTSQTLKELGLFPQETVFVQKRD